MMDAFPLTWPSGWPRTKHPSRAAFQTSFGAARDALLRELRLLKAKNVVISSNMQLRSDGLPYARQGNIDDVGIAVYFKLRGVDQCIPCDKWSTCTDNLQAIRKTIEAIRGLERWGAKEMVNAAFRGFKALPMPSSESQMTPNFFSDCVDFDHLKSRYKRLAKELHPDAGGSAEEFAELQRQFQLAKEDFS